MSGGGAISEGWVWPLHKVPEEGLISKKCIRAMLFPIYDLRKKKWSKLGSDPFFMDLAKLVDPISTSSPKTWQAGASGVWEGSDKCPWVPLGQGGRGDRGRAKQPMLSKAR